MLSYMKIISAKLILEKWKPKMSNYRFCLYLCPISNILSFGKNIKTLLLFCYFVIISMSYFKHLDSAHIMKNQFCLHLIT